MADDDKIEAISHYFNGNAAVESVTPCSGGVNNFVFYVDVTLDQHPQRYVLRIYNNGNNLEKVEFEHFILTNIPTDGLSFSLPIPIFSNHNTTFVHLKSGTHAALFPLIPGELPKLRFVRQIGYASGQLSRALSKVSVPKTMKIPTPPYHDLYEAHPSVKSSKVFFTFVAQPSFAPVRDTMDFLSTHIRAMESRIHTLLTQNFPCQLIHGDLHYDNVLCDGATGKVTALLDFEFCAWDWRAMELAICLSKYAGEPEPMPYFREFIAGFMDGDGARLESGEVDNVVRLVVLRILSNVVFFVGRAIAGEDAVETLVVRVKTYAKRIVWLEENEGEICALLKREVARVRNEIA